MSLSEKMLRFRKFDRPGSDGDSRDRKVVCRKCGTILRDCEPATRRGEFYHRARVIRGKDPCPHTGKTFDLDSKEVSQFVRKRVRRAAKRLGTSV